MPWTWGDFAFVPDSWKGGESLTPEECWKHQIYFGNGAYSVSENTQNKSSREWFWTYWAEKAWLAKQGDKEAMDFFNRKGGQTPGEENCNTYSSYYNKLGPFVLAQGDLYCRKVYRGIDKMGQTWSKRGIDTRIPPSPDKICSLAPATTDLDNPCFKGNQIQKMLPNIPYYQSIPEEKRAYFKNAGKYITAGDFSIVETGKASSMLKGVSFEKPATVTMFVKWNMGSVRRPPESYTIKVFRQAFDRVMNNPDQNTELHVMGKDSYLKSWAVAGARDFRNNNNQYEGHAELRIYSVCDPSDISITLLLWTDFSHGPRDKPEVLNKLKESAGSLAKQYMQVFLTSLDQSQ